MKIPDLTRFWIIALVLSTCLIAGYVSENVFGLLESATVAGLKPNQRGKDKAHFFPDLKYGDNSWNYLDIYGAAGSRPVLVILRGGYGQGGNKANYSHLAVWAVRKGFVAVVPDTRLAYGPVLRLLHSQEERMERGFRNQLTDYQLADSWIRQNIHSYGGDPSRMHLMAVHDGALFALQLTGQGYKTIVLLSPILNPAEPQLPDSWVGEPFLGIDRKSVAMAIPEKIPALCLVGEYDPEFIRNQVQESCSSDYRKFVIVPGQTHKSLAFKIGTHYHEATPDVQDFWKENALADFTQ